MVTQLGQFLHHNITLTQKDELHDFCVNPEGDESCFQIVLSQNDTIYTTLSTPQNCHKFTQSTARCEDLSTVREQTNEITTFVDASNVYGPADETIAFLRMGSCWLTPTPPPTPGRCCQR
jgi:hypothetical protein